MLALALSLARAQDSPAPPASTPATDSTSQQQQQPVPAFGQDTAPAPMVENPPISGLDQPGLEPHASPLSYLQPGATISESAGSNVTNTTGGGNGTSITTATGSLMLQRLWKNYDLGLQYKGGVAYYNFNGAGWKLLQQLDLDQKITWKRGQLSLRDSFSYLPEGNFGGSYGSFGSQGIAGFGGGLSGFWGGSNLGSVGVAPRILNVSVADVSENITPKSAITAAVGYAFTHFYGTDLGTGASFIGGSQTMAQVGYSRLLTSRTQMALVYGYQGFDFSIAGTAFHAHLIQGMYGHRITGRMDLLLGAGPQILRIDTQGAVCSDPSLQGLACLLAGDTLVATTIKDTKVGVAAQARLRYKFPRTSLDLTYEHFLTSGSGLFAGSESDIIRLTAERPLSRVWTAFGDIGYSHNSRVQPLTPQQLGACGAAVQGSQGSQIPCPANDATTYNYGFIGGGLHRSFGRNFHAFGSYQFNELAFGESFCIPSVPCNRISNRQVVTFGLDWTPRPIRID